MESRCIASSPITLYMWQLAGILCFINLNFLFLFHLIFFHTVSSHHVLSIYQSPYFLPFSFTCVYCSPPNRSRLKPASHGGRFSPGDKVTCPQFLHPVCIGRCLGIISLSSSGLWQQFCQRIHPHIHTHTSTAALSLIRNFLGSK